MVVDEENNFVSQRERCKMALVCPSFDDDGSLILESSQLGMDRLKASLYLLIFIDRILSCFVTGSCKQAENG